jgi:sodium/bile acid cotransporter 7
MTKNAGGNEVVSLLNGLLGNILGIFISPALIYLLMQNTAFGVVKQQYDIDGYLHVIGKLSLTVLLPLFIGQIINRIWTEKVLWAKAKFYFTEVNSVALLILVWSVLCNLFQSGLLSTVSTFDLLTLIVLNALLYISFTLLALFIGRLPNLFICRRQNHNEQPSLLEHQQKQLTLIERWRFSRENTIALMFCGSTKTLAQGVPLITAVFVNSNQGLIGLLIIPLILYFVEQLILGSIEVLLLQRWIKQPSKNNTEQLLQQRNISSNIVTDI